MNIALAIEGLYPDLENTIDFKVENRNGVQTLVEWNSSYPRPTDADLARGWFLFQKIQKKREFVQRHKSDFIAMFADVDPESAEPAAQALHLAIVDVLMAIVDPQVPPNKPAIKALRTKLKRARTNVDTVDANVGSNPDYAALADQIANMDWSAQ